MINGFDLSDAKYNLMFGVSNVVMQIIFVKCSQFEIDLLVLCLIWLKQPHKYEVSQVAALPMTKWG